MFTGLVQIRGKVEAIRSTHTGARLSISVHNPWDVEEWRRPISAGESVSVQGCCLTVADPIPVSRPDGTPQPVLSLHFDAVPETLAVTTLGALRSGSRVNLERSVTAASLMGGHIVQGHVDGIGRVASVATSDGYRVRVVPSDAGMMQYVAPKGSVCLDGVSLTVAALGPDWFEVALIPTTLAMTTLADLTAGDRCNMEFDIIAKTVVHWLRTYSPVPPPPPSSVS